MSASNIDPDIQAAFSNTAPAASSHANVDADILDAFKADDSGKTNSRAPSTQEATSGPLGFINGIAELGGKSVLNIPYNAMHGAQGILRQALGSDRNAPDSPAIEALRFPLSENAKNAGSSIGETLAPITAPVGKEISKNLGRLAPIASDVASMAPAASMAVGGASRLADLSDLPEVSAIEQGHPLTKAAQSEIEEMETHAKAAEAAGVTLPPRQVTAAQGYANNGARRDLGLPQNAPITDGLLDAAKKQNVTPAYQAAKAVPDYSLGPKYQEALDKINLSKIDPEWRPPTTGTMSGERAVELSGQLRSVARGMYEDAGNMNLTYAQRAEARTAAQAHYQAAKAVEGGFREGAGNPQIADAWDQARIYNAKTEAWRGALDGAGNVSGPKIKKLLADEPITGPMKEVASVVAQYPELFRSTRLQTPQEGMLKRGLRSMAPIAGAAAGEAIAPGSMGSMGGAALGEYTAQKFLGPGR